MENVEKINRELAEYKEDLLKRPQVIAANKTDIPGSEENVARLKETYEPQGFKVFPISAATNKGLDELLTEVGRILREYPEDIVFEEEYEEYDEVKVDQEPFTIEEVEDGYFVVTGVGVEKMIGYTNIDTEKGFAFFQKYLKEKGIIEALEEKASKKAIRFIFTIWTLNFGSNEGCRCIQIRKQKKQEILKNRNFLLFYMRTICFLIWQAAFDSLFLMRQQQFCCFQKVQMLYASWLKVHDAANDLQSRSRNKNGNDGADADRAIQDPANQQNHADDDGLHQTDGMIWEPLAQGDCQRIGAGHSFARRTYKNTARSPNEQPDNNKNNAQTEIAADGNGMEIRNPINIIAD